MFVGTLCCLQAQPGPYINIKMKFTFKYEGQQMNLWFPHFKALTSNTEKMQLMMAYDQTQQFMLLVQSPYQNLQYELEGYHPFGKKHVHTLNIEWDNDSTTVDLFLFPIPPEQRGQTKITISSYYVMYLRLKMQDENKLGQWDQHFKINIPYQSGSYEFNFFDFDSYTKKTYEVNKHWKPQKHPTKMYTFRVR